MDEFRTMYGLELDVILVEKLRISSDILEDKTVWTSETTDS